MKKHKKWEYKTIVLDDLNLPCEEDMNLFGDAGWELVFVISKSNVVMFFKRELNG